ncbi:helix-turn-helix domain-containing protein [Nonomuraea sp. NPDC046802]|uniref:helix-turn-helix domain-containing protein n=1 Tax=Nonomuraea sp. NPDC046802 TaxID=3154919 RepID=UPI0033F3B4E7
MFEILGFDPMRDLAPHHWAAIGAGGVVLLLGVLRWLKGLFFPKRAQPGKPQRSLADAVTSASAAAVLVFAGEGIFEVAGRAAPDVPWLPWLGIFLLEAPLLAFALRAKELIGAERRDEAGQAIRLTWLFATLSAAISASSALSTGDLSLPLIRAAAPIMGVILWHHALNIELNENGRPKRQSRWKWTPEYLLTRLGLLTARATDTADAEVHLRLTKVADWVIRYARAAVRNTQRNTAMSARWHNLTLWRLERIYRAAERDLDLTRNTDRAELLEQIIVSRNAVVLLALQAGATRTDLGLPEMEQAAVEQARNIVRMLFRTIEQPRAQQRNTVRIVFHKPVKHARSADRNTRGTGHRNTGGTGNSNTGNSRRATGDDRSSNTQRNTGKPTREQLEDAIARSIRPDGEVPCRELARELGISPSTVSRAASRYREEHGLPIEPGREADELIAALSNGHRGTADDTEPLAAAAAANPN